jgi:hypothetical protein
MYEQIIKFIKFKIKSFKVMIIYNFFKYLILNIKYSRIIKKVYNDENLIEGLSKIFKTNFKLDWIGRLYAVLNPNLDENGNYNPNSQIFEYGENGLNNEKMIEQWVMERMLVISNFIRANNLFELLTYSIKKIDQYDNYLFILQPITLDECMKWSKKMVILTLLAIIIGVAVLIVL